MEWEHEERPRFGSLDKFYNVLWIEWENGIAYRKGAGRIVKAIWEARASEWVDLTLG
jgi:hypothetical protein